MTLSPLPPPLSYRESSRRIDLHYIDLDCIKMPVSLLLLPYELREQILTSLLSTEGSIMLQCRGKSRSIFTPSISQVCQVLRDEAIQVFSRVNTFHWSTDSEAVSSIPDFL